MTEQYEIKVPVISVEKHARYGFNAKYTINPSLRNARMRSMPMADTLKEFNVGTAYTTLEFFAGAICVIPNSRQIALLKQVKSPEDSYTVKPQPQASTFNGVSIE